MARLAALLLLALPAALGGQAPAVVPAADPVEALDAYTAKAVRDWQVPGLAISVVKDGRLVFAKGYGVRELGKPAPVDSATLFAIGSTTKAMTAAAVAMLVDEGKVRWDDPVTRYIPGFQTADPYVTSELTVRDLLTHRGGLGNADYLWYESDIPAAEVRRRLRFLRPAYSLRSSFIYQNVMYAVAGDVVEAASGTPWEEFVRRRLLTPLAMARTVATLREAQTRENVAAPHDRVDGVMRLIRNASVDPVAPAGSIWSSVADMAKWMRFMLDSARTPDGRRLLQPATWAELLRLYGGLQAQADSARARAEAQRVAGTRPTLALDRYARTYTDSLYGTVAVTLEGARLALRRGARTATLEHWHSGSRWGARRSGAGEQGGLHRSSERQPRMNAARAPRAQAAQLPSSVPGLAPATSRTRLCLQPTSPPLWQARNVRRRPHLYLRVTGVERRGACRRVDG